MGEILNAMAMVFDPVYKFNSNFISMWKSNFNMEFLFWIWIGFGACGSFSLSDDSGFGKNVIIFGGDMSSSVHIDNKKKYILILGKYTADGSDNTTLTA